MRWRVFEKPNIEICLLTINLNKCITYDNLTFNLTATLYGIIKSCYFFEFLLLDTHTKILLIFALLIRNIVFGPKTLCITKLY